MHYFINYILCRHRYRLHRLYRSAVFYGLALIFFLLVYNLPAGSIFPRLTGCIDFSLFDIAANIGERDPAGLLRSAMPVMAWAGDREDYPEDITIRSMIFSLAAPFKIDLSDPLLLLRTAAPAMAALPAPVTGSSPDNSAAVVLPDAGEKINSLTSVALVGIYYTHTGENYALTDGVERVTGGRGGVVEAGAALKESLERKGIRVAHDQTINDSSYQLSYLESEKVLRRMLEENPHLQVVVDLHRDAGKPREESLVEAGGHEVAPVLFIVGSDARAPFPTWRSNYEFALKIAARLNSKYPGLCIGVRVKEGRYNQYLHPGALLVEIGSVCNSIEEAIASSILLGDALAEEVRELTAGNPDLAARAGVSIDRRYYPPAAQGIYEENPE